MKGNLRLLAALSAVLCVAAVAGVLLYLSAPGTEVPMAAPGPAGRATVDRFVPLDPPADFSAVAPRDPAGQPADMALYRDKALLVNLWATWCAPCIEELPSLAKLQEMLGGADFAVVTIAIDEPNAAKVAPFLAEHDAASLPALIDTDRTIDKVMPVAALPTSLLVDRQGKIRASLTGDADWHCGAALEAVKAFVTDGSVSDKELAACE